MGGVTEMQIYEINKHVQENRAAISEIRKVIRHINSHMFGVIDDKPEGFINYKHEPVGRGFIHYHINHGRVYVL